ncbi:MAG: tetratricopeptide repeat protein [Saprospiraceae bacterium]
MAKRKLVSNQSATGSQNDTLVDLGGVQKQFHDIWVHYGDRITYIGGGILAIIVAYMAYQNFYAAPRQQEALKQMFMAEQKFAQDSFQVALNGNGVEFSGFKDIASQYGSTPAGNLAHYYAGVCNLNLGNYDDAVKYLDDYDGGGDVGCIMKHGALGDTYSEKDMYDKAISQYEKAVDEGDDEVLTPYYMKKLAMLNLYEKVNKPAEAKKLYLKIKEKYPKSVEAQECDKNIARLEAKGI